MCEARKISVNKWDSVINEAKLAKNNMCNKSSKVDSFKCLFGKNARLPIDNFVSLSFTGESVDKKVIQESARINRVESASNYKSCYDKNSNVIDFKPGDEVLLRRNFGEYPKMNVKWVEGPYVIGAKIGPSNFCVWNSKNQSRVLHHNQLKKAVTRQEPVRVPAVHEGPVRDELESHNPVQLSNTMDRGGFRRNAINTDINDIIDDVTVSDLDVDNRNIVPNNPPQNIESNTEELVPCTNSNNIHGRSRYGRTIKPVIGNRLIDSVRADF